MSTEYTNSRQKEILSNCLIKIENKLEWLSSAEWRHSHFELLSERIFLDTNVRLSPVTLKRIWGKVSYHSFPSISTLDALAKFIGYENWISFQRVSEKQDKKSIQVLYRKFLEFLNFNFKKFAYAFGVILLIILAVLIASNKWLSQSGSMKAIFDFKPVTLGVPNTVIFTYDAEGSNADSVFIQQSWDPKLRRKVDKNSNIFTTTYYYPGFYKAKLILNDKIVSEKDLHIKSDGWIGTIEKSPVPFYLNYNEIYGSDMIEINSDHLIKRGYDLNAKLPNTNLYIVEDFGEISGNDFKLITKFKNTLGMGEAICQKSNIYILYSEARYNIPFSIKGCIGELNMMIPGKFIGGQKNDLSGFGVDFSDWVTLEVTAVNGGLEMMVNKQSVYKDTLSVDPGKLIGVKYKFHGTGAVKSLEIQSAGQIKFETSF